MESMIVFFLIYVGPNTEKRVFYGHSKDFNMAKKVFMRSLPWNQNKLARVRQVSDKENKQDLC